MDEQDSLAERFEANRSYLRGVAYRILGSLAEADDAVQEAWLRLCRADAGGIDNLRAWLTTVVARVCLDVLRSHRSRRELSLDAQLPETIGGSVPGSDPEDEALLADSVGLALLVVLHTLNPSERLAFVLHDLFAVPFDEIAPIVGRTPTAARQLASRARRRVRGSETVPDGDFARRREVVDAFLAAARGGHFDGLLAVLDPDVVVRADRALAATGAPPEVRGAAAVARHFLGTAQAARAALVNGALGVVVAPRGRLLLALSLVFAGGKIAAIDAIGDPERLRGLDLKVIDA